MCQLLGLNSSQPTDICFSFTGFKARGGVTDHHADGWGIAFFEGRGVRILQDHLPSCKSALAELVCAHPIPATNIIGHIRKATRGDVCLENTHPFHRELWGRHWVFAHNGTLADFAPQLNGRFRPVGRTDSELAFCWLMQGLQDTFGDYPPDQHSLFEFVREASIAITQHGPFNFLLSNGELLFANCSTRLSYLDRQAPYAPAHLIDSDVTMDFGASGSAGGRTVVIATTPLTDNEQWTSMPAGSLWCFANGEVLATAPTLEGRIPVDEFAHAPSVSRSQHQGQLPIQQQMGQARFADFAGVLSAC